MNPESDITLWQAIEAGEYVMIAVTVVLLAALWIYVARMVKIGKDMKPASHLMARIRDYVVEGDIENARHACERSGIPVAKVVEKGLSRIGRQMIEVMQVMEEASAIEKEWMQRGLGWIHALAVISPLLGFGGTLAGIMVALRWLAMSGPLADMADIAAAIWPSFITVLAGIAAGIIILVFKTSLQGRILRAERDIDNSAADFINLLNEPI